MGKIPTYKKKRLDTQRRGKYYINPIVMPDYNKLVIKRLAVHYSRDQLIEKLIELKYCSLKTALEVLFDEKKLPPERRFRKAGNEKFSQHYSNRGVLQNEFRKGKSCY